ncbi:hypothetical protein SARC_05818 [Sphaeroforma arctica JP610]|uniref:Phospholipid/glycerol acyltransferase domain-containing protein n=1 Tax=Sphaeroforma arctica JP610 TaxID=667725 RepID=A0A0L0FYG1_9EUKA|nr:hypothetical protein SARC_05818 [Sphaeroforma arctica JP610]KNC81887.1 hypothetical protein SARC_05818 [Sphaeroforma arctica JP610]|eukprot:XP_014155789.1 hypothetical protein SARC_05818 [Sphaeroforma arctica JP610]
MTVAPRAESTIVDANNPTPDPFVAYRRQDTPYTVLEVMKTTLTSLSLFPVRLGIFSFVAVTSCLAATILTAGVDPGNPMAEPLSPIRRRLMRFVCWYAGAGGCLAFGIYVNTTKTVKLDLPPLVIFPEGTTTNGVEMVSFRTGVFRCKAPVTPVCLRYPNKHYSLSWETVPITTHVWRLMTQFVNFVEVIPLDEYKPSQEELADAYLYADNVQKMMAEVMECGYSTTTTREHKVAYHDSILGNLTYDQALAR